MRRFQVSIQMRTREDGVVTLGPGVHDYKAYLEGSADGLSDIPSQVYAAMMTAPLEAGYCPEGWKKVIDVMLEKIPGVVRLEKLRIIQLLGVD
jgi:hypothetical protein